MADSLIAKERKKYHDNMVASNLLLWSKVKSSKRNYAFFCPSNADADSAASVFLASHLCMSLGIGKIGKKLDGQSAGKKFEELTEDFIAGTFPRLQNLRPGKWKIQRKKTKGLKNRISNFAQYSHLDDLGRYIAENPLLASLVNPDYLVGPDIVIAREPCEDDEINICGNVVGDDFARHTPIRLRNNHAPILHASISAKWTIRSDRSQNSRTEALNLIRIRKDRLPHIVVATAEPLPSRLASVAFGTGDIDCIYHFALHELVEAVNAYAMQGHDEPKNILNILIDGRRLRDISDLPLDLAI